jgi:hypothetical protein
MSAAKLLHIKKAFGTGIIEIVIWQVPAPVTPSTHPYKYRLVYVVDGKRIVVYDNERGKGDHKHINGIEKPYRFVNPKRLIDDFMKDVKGAKHE